MSAKVDIAGKTFGRLTVLAESGRVRKEIAWRCRCACGNEAVIAGYALRTGATKSCGCLNSAEAKRVRNTRHGLADTRIHRSWMSMLGRCERSTDSAYPSYGGRGITVCARWHTFEHFAADMGAMPDTHTLERVDVNGNYEPSNCKWATYQEQASNTRRNVMLEFCGERRTLSAWSNALGLKRVTVAYRLKSGWTVEQALSVPTMSPKQSSALARNARWGNESPGSA